jgi:hypothetical protein
MSKKPDRATYEPSWAEVILGATLSLALGVVLGAALLVIKPVTQVKELPKEDARVANAVYYIEGSRDTAKARQALAKRKAFAEGQSVSATEDELNSLLAAAPAPQPKPGAKKDEKAAPPPPPSAEMVSAGTPNFRIRDGALQIAVPLTINALGLDHKLIVQARGGFERKADGFVFEPSTLYLGSCPVQRLPVIGGLVRSRVLAAQAIPEDIATAWKKAANVTIEGNTVKVAMQ